MKIDIVKLKELIEDSKNVVSVKLSNEFVPVRVKAITEGYELEWNNSNGETYNLWIPYDALELTEQGVKGDTLFVKHIFDDFIEIQISKPINFAEDL